MIAEAIRDHLLKNSAGQKIADLRIGLKYTAVLLDDGNAGIAFTFRDSLPEHAAAFKGKHPLAGRSALELLSFLGSPLLVESSVGLATANALANRPGGPEEEGDVLDAIAVTGKDRVGMVGFFPPLVASLRKVARELIVFEQNQHIAEGVVSGEKASLELPRCDIALITATSLINGTVDSLIECSRSCREIVLLGGSTPLLPELFGPLGITLLSGVVVKDATGILRAVSEGGGRRMLEKYVRKVNVRLSR